MDPIRIDQSGELGPHMGDRAGQSRPGLPTGIHWDSTNTPQNAFHGLFVPGNAKILIDELVRMSGQKN